MSSDRDWTSTPPQEPGWYWIFPEPKVKLIIQIHEDDEGIFVFHWFSGRLERYLQSLNWLWSERIPEPGEDQ